MASPAKYKAKAVFWNLRSRSVVEPKEIDKYRHKSKLRLPDFIIRFDSTHEFKVYLELCRMYGAERIIRQYQVDLISPCICYPKGKSWKCDFAITETAGLKYYTHLVEAKGLFLPEYGNIISLLEVQNPFAFYRLRTVFSESIPYKKHIISAIAKSELYGNLLTLKDLADLKILP